ncbi:hypothetical protein [Coleofasciculus sp. G2-EDA-02]|uniref:hypothetical protein n=1 Tax=Coleofasciculus sp. G2-EDA-02 TaxID=3069529 RepID=UPI0032F95A64
MPDFSFLSLIVAQTPPTPIPSPDLELIKQQMEFFKDANSQLTESFNAFIGTLNLAFVLMGIFLGILGIVGTFFYGKTLNDIKQSVNNIVDQEVNRIVSQTIRAKVDYLQKVLEREEVIGWITIDYLLPTNQSVRPPQEFKLLQKRGFQDVKIRYRVPDSRRRSRDILVLDLVNHQLPDSEIVTVINQVIDNLAPTSVLIVYVSGISKPVEELKKGKKVEYYTVANNRISLISAAVNCAYIADALRQGDDL